MRTWVSFLASMWKARYVPGEVVHTFNPQYLRDCEFKASLTYVTSFRTVRSMFYYTVRPCLQSGEGERPGVVVHIVIPALGKWRQEDHRDLLPASGAQLVSSRFSKTPTPQNEVDNNWGKRPISIPLTPAHAHTYKGTGKPGKEPYFMQEDTHSASLEQGGA